MRNASRLPALAIAPDLESMVLQLRSSSSSFKEPTCRMSAADRSCWAPAISRTGAASTASSQWAEWQQGWSNSWRTRFARTTKHGHSTAHIKDG